MTAPRSMTLLAPVAALLSMACDKPTPNERIEDARIAAQMNEVAAQRRTEKMAADRASADRRQKSWEDSQRQSDAEFERGISPVDE